MPFNSAAGPGRRALRFGTSRRRFFFSRCGRCCGRCCWLCNGPGCGRRNRRFCRNRNGSCNRRFYRWRLVVRRRSFHRSGSFLRDRRRRFHYRRLSILRRRLSFRNRSRLFNKSRLFLYLRGTKIKRCQRDHKRGQYKNSRSKNSMDFGPGVKLLPFFLFYALVGTGFFRSLFHLLSFFFYLFFFFGYFCVQFIHQLVDGRIKFKIVFFKMD